MLTASRTTGYLAQYLRPFCTQSSVLLAVIILNSACGLFRSNRAAGVGSANSAGSTSRLEQRWDAKPSLSLIERNGDPAAALAFAAKTRAGPVAIVTLASVVQKQLSTSLGRYEIFRSSFGLTLVSLVGSPEEAELAVRAVDFAFGSPVKVNQLDDITLDQVRTVLGSGLAASPRDVAFANCSGELVADSRQLDILNNKAKLLDMVERARLEFHSWNNARFAFVGTRNIAIGVERAIGQMQPWAQLSSSRDDVAAVSESYSGIAVKNGASRSLSIAWRVNSIARADRAALALIRKGSPLLAQVVALDTGWKIDTISAIARDIGACLRIDLSAGDTLPISPVNLATISRIVTTESRVALEASPELVGQDFGVDSDNDPRLAARRVAWNSLSTPERSTRFSFRVHLSTLPTDGPISQLESILHESLSARAPINWDTTHRLETGQGEQWVLLASPCGTSTESSDDAGSTAAWIRAIARHYSDHLGVQVEPWLIPDGVGFIAHCPAQSPTESPTAIAARLGNALGSIVATGSVSGAELAAVREDALLRVGSTPRRAFWQLVNTLSSSRPSSFEPLGSFESICKLELANLRTSRLKWLDGPLRLSTLLNRSENQLAPLSAALHRWLDPQHVETRQCAQTAEAVRPSSDIQISTRNLDTRDSNLYMAVQLAPENQENLIYEHWLLWLLARSGGWLEIALAQPASLNSFTADIKGPRHNRSLIVAVSVADEAKTADCVLRLRTLFSHLAEVGADAQEVRLVQTWSEDQIRRAELDPRRRLVDLWWGDSVPPKPQLSGFSRYLNRSFASAAVTVVRIHRQL